MKFEFGPEQSAEDKILLEKLKAYKNKKISFEDLFSVLQNYKREILTPENERGLEFFNMITSEMLKEAEKRKDIEEEK
ncbi:MAG: hypothetical protein ABII97_02170 [Patescibacteria group bacterium]